MGGTLGNPVLIMQNNIAFGYAIRNRKYDQMFD